MSRIEQRMIVTRFLSFTNCGKVRHTFQNEPLERSPRNRRDIGNKTTRDRKLEVNLMSLTSSKSTRKSSPRRIRFLVYSCNANAQISFLIFNGDPSVATEKRSSIDRMGSVIWEKSISRVGARNHRQDFSGGTRRNPSFWAKEAVRWESIPAISIHSEDANTRKSRATENENFSLREIP